MIPVPTNPAVGSDDPATGNCCCGAGVPCDTGGVDGTGVASGVPQTQLSTAVHPGLLH